jgi:hypothetical protein
MDTWSSTGIHHLHLDKNFKTILSNQKFEGAEFQNNTLNLRFFQNKIFITTSEGLKSYNSKYKQFKVDEQLQKWLFGAVIQKIFNLKR